MMSLQSEIEKARAEIKTDAYSMSIGEWMNLYQDNEIDVHPEFQRFYRWSHTQKTNFIESILLGIPIPPIFVAQNDEGIWDVVDGLQRLSTIFEFAGILKDEEDNLLSPLTLQKTKYLPSLEGKTWVSQDHPDSSFTAAQRRFVKRAKLGVSIILRESDEKAQYELFQRLNTGGSLLSMQEVRNCIIVMLEKDFYFWLRELASYEPFQECIALTDKATKEQYDLELALRFIIFRQMETDDLNSIRDVGEFLTDRMVEIISESSIEKHTEETAFKRTFDILNESLGNNSFHRYNLEKEKHYGGFLLSAFEVIALGLGYHTHETSFDINIEEVEKRAKEIWTNSHFQSNSGSGVRASSRIPQLIPFGRNFFAQ